MTGNSDQRSAVSNQQGKEKTNNRPAFVILRQTGWRAGGSYFRVTIRKDAYSFVPVHCFVCGNDGARTGSLSNIARYSLKMIGKYLR